jgi:hypothetical protein
LVYFHGLADAIYEAGEERGNDDYRKDKIYGKDGEDVTAKLASLLLRTYHVDVSAKMLDLGGKSNGGRGHTKSGRQDPKNLTYLGVF